MGKQSKTQPAESAKAYQLLPIPDLSGGVDLRSAATLLPSEKARTLVNWSLEQPGALMVRPGYDARTDAANASLGNSRIQGGSRIYLNTAIPSANSTAFTLVGWNGGLYLDSDSGGWFSTTPHLTGLSTVNDLIFPHDRDLVAVMDGSTTPWKSTNGSSWTKLGIERPSTGPVLSSGGSGSLSSAEFEIGFTYKDRDLAHESNGPASGSTISLSATGSIAVVVPNSTQPAVDAIVVYARNKTSGETVRRKASSQVQSAGTHSTIVLTSSNWSANDEEPTDHNTPPVLSFGVPWKNRWWARSATVANRIHFTQLFQPQSWPTLFYLDIPFEQGDEIRALVPLGDTLMVFGTTRIFVIIGQTSLDFDVRPTLDSQDGAFGPRAIAVLENGVVHAGSNGVYIFDGTQDRLLSYALDPAWRDLVKNASISDLLKLAMVYDGQRKELRIAVPRRYPSATWGEWVLDLNRTRGGEEAWTATDRTIGGYIVWRGPEASAGNRGRLFSWHSSVARLFEENVGTSANSSNLTAEYEGPGLTLGTRLGRWIDTRGEYEPNDGAFSIEALIDGVSQGSKTIAIGAGLSRYGTAVYGTNRYGGATRRQFYTPLPLTAQGRTYTQKAVYVGQTAFTWYGYAPGLVPETRSRDFTE
jgi:hypothetical protein